MAATDPLGGQVVPDDDLLEWLEFLCHTLKTYSAPALYDAFTGVQEAAAVLHKILANWTAHACGVEHFSKQIDEWFAIVECHNRIAKEYEKAEEIIKDDMDGLVKEVEAELGIKIDSIDSLSKDEDSEEKDGNNT